MVPEQDQHPVSIRDHVVGLRTGSLPEVVALRSLRCGVQRGTRVAIPRASFVHRCSRWYLFRPEDVMRKKISDLKTRSISSAKAKSVKGGAKAGASLRTSAALRAKPSAKLGAARMSAARARP